MNREDKRLKEINKIINKENDKRKKANMPLCEIIKDNKSRD